MRFYNGILDLASHKLPALARALAASTDCHDLRMGFFTNDMTEQAVKVELERRERRCAHLQQVHSCLSVVRDVGVETLGYIAHNHTMGTIHDGLRRLGEVVIFSNSRLADIGRMNNMAVPALLTDEILRHSTHTMWNS